MQPYVSHIVLFAERFIKQKLRSETQFHSIFTRFYLHDSCFSFPFFLKAGDTETVTLDVSNIDPEKIEPEVKNGTLQIKTKKGHCSNFKAKITVSYRTLKSVANSGSTDIVALSPIKADKFELASSGSGDFKGELDVKDLEIGISGSSDMTLNGNADIQDILSTALCL